MTDIHSHILYGVDDGPKTIEGSLALLKLEAEQGVKKVILTPHYRESMFPYKKSRVEGHFQILKEEAESQNIPIDIYLGCEYHVDDYIIDNLTSGKVHSLGDTDYVLTEYSNAFSFKQILYYSERLIDCGYIPIIAHAERYGCLLKKPRYCKILRESGALIQCNADAILGLEGLRVKRFCKKLLKKSWVDFVASDAHNLKTRSVHIKDAFEYIEKKKFDIKDINQIEL